jgi:hypothetical protein
LQYRLLSTNNSPAAKHGSTWLWRQIGGSAMYVIKA